MVSVTQRQNVHSVTMSVCYWHMQCFNLWFNWTTCVRTVSTHDTRLTSWSSKQDDLTMSSIICQLWSYNLMAAEKCAYLFLNNTNWKSRTATGSQCLWFLLNRLYSLHSQVNLSTIHTNSRNWMCYSRMSYRMSAICVQQTNSIKVVKKMKNNFNVTDRCSESYDAVHNK